MAIEFNPASRTLPRAELSLFLPNDRAIRAFEDLQTDMTQAVPGAIGGIGEALDGIVASQVVLWQASDAFTDGRVVCGGVGISTNVTPTQLLISLRETGVGPGIYGGPTDTPSFQVDGYGRLLVVHTHRLVSDNVAEGEQNQYFTRDRARAALIDAGEFAPTVRGTTGGQAATSVANGQYVKVGRLVSVQIRLSLSDASGLAGGIQIGGLPFVPSSGAAGRAAARITLCNNLTGHDLGSVLGTFVGSTGVITVADNAGAIIPVAALTNSTALDISATYQTA